jgi:hypothetical protein
MTAFWKAFQHVERPGVADYGPMPGVDPQRSDDSLNSGRSRVIELTLTAPRSIRTDFPQPATGSAKLSQFS